MHSHFEQLRTDLRARCDALAKAFPDADRASHELAFYSVRAESLAVQLDAANRQLASYLPRLEAFESDAMLCDFDGDPAVIEFDATWTGDTVAVRIVGAEVRGKHFLASEFSDARLKAWGAHIKAELLRDHQRAQQASNDFFAGVATCAA